MVAGIGKLRRGRRPYFQPEHGRKYGQDRRCRYFSNDFNAKVRTRYPLLCLELPYPLQPLMPNPHRANRPSCPRCVEPLRPSDWLPER